MVRTSRLLLSAAVCGIIGFGAMNAQAADVDIDATLSVSPALTIGTPVDVDYGSIDYTAGAHSGVIEYGSDGTVNVASGSGLVASGTPVAGSVTVTESTATLDISCDVSAVISDGTNTIAISGVKWDTSATATYAAAANTCAGLGTSPVAVDTSVTNNPVINVGTALTVGTNGLDAGGTATYATGSAGGDPITFRIVSQ